jgi:hypothetical protein
LIKIFVSHQNSDTATATAIAVELRRFPDVSTYVDALDMHLLQGASDLGAHFRKALADCTHLMAVVSTRTQSSWWVPFEIGMATEKDYPISSYAVENVQNLLDYLKKWPYLRDREDLTKYVDSARRTGRSTLIEDMRKVADAAQRRNYSDAFHRDLKKVLGQY